MDKSDTVWMIIASTYVFFMVPGLALFYGGLVRSKNVLSTMMHSFVAILALTLHWTVLGYTFSAEGESPFFGDFSKILLTGVNSESLSGTIPEYVFFFFQVHLRS